MRILRRLSYLLHHRSREDDLAEELAFHEAMKQRQLDEAGVDAARATSVRRKAMGNVTSAREDARAVWIWPWLDSVWQDVSYGARMLAKHPGFTAISVLALSAGIGLNTSLFTVTNALLFRPWDVSDARSIVTLSSLDCCKRAGGQPHGFSLDEIKTFADRARTIVGVYAYRAGEGSDVDVDGTTMQSAWVSASYFKVLDLQMYRGRGFRPEIDRGGSDAAEAVLTYGAWQRRFGGDTTVVGRVVRIDDYPFRIVGVGPRHFAGTFDRAVEVWIPLQAVALMRPDDKWVKNVLLQPANCCTAATARLATGMTPHDAQVELAALSRNARATVGAPFEGVYVSDFTPLAGPRGQASQVVHTLVLLWAAMGVVLLLVCANVANLLLARTAARTRELAVRLSLGASRQRIVRQLVTEGAALAFLGACGGIAIAFWLPPILVRATIRQSHIDVHPNASVLGFTLALTVATCLIFGLPTALHATHSRATAGIRTPLRNLFLSVQIALCVLLLVSAGLLVRGVQHATGSNSGMPVREVTAVSFEYPSRALAEAHTKQFVSQLRFVVQDLRRGTPIAFSTAIPLSSTGKAEVRLPNEDDTRSQDILTNQVTEGYFDVLRIPRVAGSSFAADADPNVIIVNETLAKLYGDANALVGRTVLISGLPKRVIGVVKDLRASSLERVEPTAYEPFTGDGLATILVRNDSPGAAALVAATARRLDPSVTVTITPLSVYLARRLAPSQALAQVSGALGTFALVLATIGVFGVFAFAVQQRTQEIGIRMALGARAVQVVGLVVGASARSIAAGLVVGFIGAFIASRVLRSNLYGLSPLDPVTYLSVALVLVSAGLSAAYWPARRATRIEPASALRID